jgi:hypothetical protein
MTTDLSKIKFEYPNNVVKRYHLINYLIQKYQLTSYLEVGTRRVEDNFLKIKLSSESKESIEPNPETGNPTYQMTSDEAFEKLIQQNKKYDIIFIDGLHTEDQSFRDLQNALKCLTPSLNSFIMMHDCNPLHEFMQRPNYEVNGNYPAWNGLVWKTIVKFNHDTTHPFIARVVDTDWGCGIINLDVHTGKSDLKDEYLTYSYLDQNRQKLLNLISTTEFRQYY